MTLTLDLPDVFVRLCHYYGTTPEKVLKDFISDLCGIQPATDEDPLYQAGYSTNGSDERGSARAYFNRVGYTGPQFSDH